MYARRTIAALALATAGVSLAMSTATAADTLGSAAAVTMDEQDCLEAGVSRAVLTSGLDPLVPDRYSLFHINATASRLVLTTYTCSQVSVDGQPVVGHDKPTTVTIGSAVVTTRDGEPLPTSQQQYIVWYGTDNPLLFAKLQQTGLPVSFLPRSSVEATSNGAITTVDWAIRGAGLDYDLTAEGAEPVTDPVTSTTTWWYDGPKGNLKITYENLFVKSAAVITADLTGNELLREIVPSPAVLTINGATIPAGFVRGSWTSQVSFVE